MKLTQEQLTQRAKKAWRTRRKNAKKLQSSVSEVGHRESVSSIVITLKSGSKMMIKSSDLVEIRTSKGVIFKK